MSKAKTAGEKATYSAESALESGAAALKTGLEKTLKGYDAFVSYGKDTAEAVTQSATTAGKGIETINSENGAPSIILHRAAAERAEAMGVGTMMVTLTHTADMAAASVVAVGK